MKSGETGVVIIEHDINTNVVDDIVFTLSSATGSVTKRYSRNEVVSKPNGKFLIPLSQEDTLFLGKPKYDVAVKVEGQINFKDKTVAKTGTEQFTLYSTLATDVVNGNNGSETQWNDVTIRVHSGVIEASSSVTDAQIEEIILQHPEMKGKSGKSAYETAQDGGYTGTEAEFTAALGNIETMTYEEIMNRLNGGDI